MTRLFFRFYVLIFLILGATIVADLYVLSLSPPLENLEVVEHGITGGAKLVRNYLLTIPEDQWDATIQEIARSFEHDVKIIGVSELDIPEYAVGRLLSGIPSVFYQDAQETGWLITPISEQKFLIFGPYRDFIGPDMKYWIIAYGSILLFTAIALVLLLRPVMKQFRIIEKTAGQIAQGDLSARIHEKHLSANSSLAHSFNSMAERTETMLRTQRELLQAVSHELRTPLARFRFGLDLLATAEDATTQKKQIQVMDDAVQDLDDLVDELLRYVRQEGSLQALHREPVSLKNTLEEIVRKRRDLKPEIEFKYGPNFSAKEWSMMADARGLERALDNVLSNASKHARSAVEIDISEENGFYRIQVDDDGPGIAPGDRYRVFEPFVRLNESQEGVGLGLALVQRIVTRHGGTVEIDDSPLGGCRISSNWPHHNS